MWKPSRIKNTPIKSGMTMKEPQLVFEPVFYLRPALAVVGINGKVSTLTSQSA